MTKEVRSSEVRWIHEVTVDGAVAFRRGKLGSQMVADWPGFATLTCAHDGSAAKVVPAEGVSRRAVAELSGAPIHALLRDLAGELALHASAVAIDGRAVVFLGESGAGKSTAAAEMCWKHRAHMLADDVSFLEVDPDGARVLPTETRHWLTRESHAALALPGPRPRDGGEKRPVASARVAGAPCPLALVVALSFAPGSTSVSARPLCGAEAARRVLSAVYRFDVEDANARRRELEQITMVYRHVPFFECVRPARAPGEVGPFVLESLRKEMP